MCARVPAFPALEEEIKLLLIPADPEDGKNAILEIFGTFYQNFFRYTCVGVFPHIPQAHARFNLVDILASGDPEDGKNAILEIRGGTGGDEAAIFAGDLCKMYRVLTSSNRASMPSRRCSRDMSAIMYDWCLALRPPAAGAHRELR